MSLHGKLLFASNRAEPAQAFDLFAIPLSAGPGETTTPIRLTHGVGHELDPALSPDGRRLIYVARPVVAGADTPVQVAGQSTSSLMLIDLDTGQRLVLLRKQGVMVQPNWSPSGNRLVFSLMTPGKADTIDHQLYLYHFATGRTSAIGAGAYPGWMPDGKRILATELSSTGGQARLVVIDPQTGARSAYSRPGPHTATIHPAGRHVAIALPEGRDGRPTIMVYPTDTHGHPNAAGTDVSFGTASNAANLEPRWLLGAPTSMPPQVTFSQTVFDQERGSAGFLSRIMVAPATGGTAQEVIPADAQNLIGGGYMTAIWLRR